MLNLSKQTQLTQANAYECFLSAHWFTLSKLFILRNRFIISIGIPFSQSDADLSRLPEQMKAIPGMEPFKTIYFTTFWHLPHRDRLGTIEGSVRNSLQPVHKWHQSLIIKLMVSCFCYWDKSQRLCKLKENISYIQRKLPEVFN